MQRPQGGVEIHAKGAVGRGRQKGGGVMGYEVRLLKLDVLPQTKSVGAESSTGPIETFLLVDHARLDALLHHLAIEENILMPLALEFRHDLAQPAHRLRQDHRRIAYLLSGEPNPARLESLRKLMETHFEIEEGPSFLYAACDRFLGKRASQIVALLESESPMVFAADRCNRMIQDWRRRS